MLGKAPPPPMRSPTTTFATVGAGRSRFARVKALYAAVMLGAGLQGGCDSCSPPPTPPTTEPAAQSVSVLDHPAADLVNADPAGAAIVPIVPLKGTGWYPNIEVDGAGRLHMAWVDADHGDVRYAVTAKGGATIEGGIQTVAEDGAAGAFLRLGIAPGGAPLLAFARQDTQIFRLAWRPSDREAMLAAGADVGLNAMPKFPSESSVGAPVTLRSGFVGEELGFGDQVGRGASLAVDKTGRFALAYYSADDRLRLVRRPTDVTAFGPDSVGVLEKRDLDSFARGSVRVVSDTKILDDGTVAVSYAHDVATDARLRVAILRPDAPRPTSVQDDSGDTITIDGLLSRLFVRADGNLDVVAHDRQKRAVVVRTVDVATGTFLPERRTLVKLEGNAVAARRAKGYFVLARVAGEHGGIFLYVVDDPPPGSDADARGQVRRVRLSGPAKQDDAWMDLVVRHDDRPAAVWYDAEAHDLKLYAP